MRKRPSLKLALCVFAAGVGVGVAHALVSSQEAPSDSDRESKFSAIASKYDELIHNTETKFGILSLREELVSRARGRVLEVASGTARNLEFYSPAAVSELILSDQSEAMARVAREKRTEVRVLHAESLPFEDARFDSVVDTYSLCSVRDPVKMLQEMQRVCRPDGQILLLEHGRSQWRLVNWYLDLLANAHARSWGCWWNRSIADLLRESHLEVVEHRTRHFGTTHLIVARPAAKEIKQSKS